MLHLMPRMYGLVRTMVEMDDRVSVCLVIIVIIRFYIAINELQKYIKPIQSIYGQGLCYIVYHTCMYGLIWTHVMLEQHSIIILEDVRAGNCLWNSQIISTVTRPNFVAHGKNYCVYSWNYVFINVYTGLYLYLGDRYSLHQTLLCL